MFNNIRNAMAPKQRLHLAHASLQFKESDQHTQHDLDLIFSRGNHIITGTEAGPGSGRTPALLREMCREYDYRLWLPGTHGTDAWVAVKRQMINGNWDAGYIPVIPSSKALEAQGVHIRPGRRWGEKGIIWVAFDNDATGRRIAVCSSHWLTYKSRFGLPHDYNADLSKAIQKWAREHARGQAIAFAGADTNTNDKRKDALDPAMITAGDALNRWESTGHGPIDILAATNKDVRRGQVRWVKVNALSDRELFLHQDHYLLEAQCDVIKVTQRG